MQITLQLKGDKALKRKMKRAPERLDRNMTQAVRNSIGKVEGDAKRNAPVDSGRLRSSIFSRMLGSKKGKVEVGAKYGIFVHEGTRPHIIRIRRKQVLANRRTGQIFGTVVHHPGTKPQPFLSDALKENRRYIENEFNQAINDALK